MLTYNILYVILEIHYCDLSKFYFNVKNTETPKL